MDSEAKSPLEFTARPFDMLTNFPSSAVVTPFLHFESENLREVASKSILSLRCRIFKQQEDLTQFEVAQIANLCPVDVDEARNCIPRYILHA